MTLRNYLCDVFKKLFFYVIKELAVIQEQFKLQKTNLMKSEIEDTGKLCRRL